jgi:hypothetical protein
MGKNQVYRIFFGHCQGKRTEGYVRSTALCPDNGTLPALRSLLSVALSSVRVRKFYHSSRTPAWPVFLCENGRLFVVIF